MNGPAVFKFKMEVRFEQFFTVFHSFSQFFHSFHLENGGELMSRNDD